MVSLNALMPFFTQQRGGIYLLDNTNNFIRVFDAGGQRLVGQDIDFSGAVGTDQELNVRVAGENLFVAHTRFLTQGHRSIIDFSAYAFDGTRQSGSDVSRAHGPGWGARNQWLGCDISADLTTAIFRLSSTDVRLWAWDSDGDRTFQALLSPSTGQGYLDVAFAGSGTGRRIYTLLQRSGAETDHFVQKYTTSGALETSYAFTGTTGIDGLLTSAIRGIIGTPENVYLHDNVAGLLYAFDLNMNYVAGKNIDLATGGYLTGVIS